MAWVKSVLTRALPSCHAEVTEFRQLRTFHMEQRMNDIPLSIDTASGRITLIVDQGDYRFSGFHISQSKNGTVLYQPESLLAKTKYKEFPLPSPRYSLAHDKPASGVEGRKEFDRDFLNFLRDQGLFDDLFKEM